MLDPAIDWILRGGLALLLVSSAGHKLRDLDAFRGALGGYDLLPERALGFASWVVVGSELAIAGALLLSPIGGLAAASLLAVYTAAIAVNLVRGRREIDCGCFGPAARQPLSTALVARNAALIALALASVLPVAPRALVWLDGLTIAAALVLSALLNATLNTLLINGPRLRALRSA